MFYNLSFWFSHFLFYFEVLPSCFTFNFLPLSVFLLFLLLTCVLLVTSSLFRSLSSLLSCSICLFCSAVVFRRLLHLPVVCFWLFLSVSLCFSCLLICSCFFWLNCLAFVFCLCIFGHLYFMAEIFSFY